MKRRDFLNNGLAATIAAAMGSRASAMAPAGAHAATMVPKAKRIIYLFLSGGPSQQDLYDYKPLLNKHHKEQMFTIGKRKGLIEPKFRLTGMTASAAHPVCGTKYDFQQHGESGAWLSELLPHTAKVADDICFIKSVHTKHINHDPAVTAIQTGSQLAGRPSLGAWLSYSLESMNGSLPGYFVMTPTWTGRKPGQPIYSRLWGSGVLPSNYQGVPIRRSGDPILHLANPKGISPSMRSKMVTGVKQFNQLNFERMHDDEITARSLQYEMARRMQDSVPELTNLKDEPKKVLDLYGPEVLQSGTFANSCLLARRMSERGVRTIQIFHRGWDQHTNLPNNLSSQCSDVDHPIYGLITDLKQRGLLEDTLIVCGGEFGRTSYCQGKLNETTYGRDHHPGCFTVWMAGGGVKAGYTHGLTDDFGYDIVKDPVSVDDLNATILHLMGIDHTRLTVRHQGLDLKLTGVEAAKVVREIMT
ncbi:MAG: DUF1501 domain-containing protein [Akkermansiaceae bacterium]